MTCHASPYHERANLKAPRETQLCFHPPRQPLTSLESELTDTITMIGSKTDIPMTLVEEVRRLEGLFVVDKKKLKEITDHFMSELAKGAWCH